MGLDIMIFSECWVLTNSFHTSLSFFIKRFFTSFSFFAIRVISLKYLTLLIFLTTILIYAFPSSSLAFNMLCMTYELWTEVCDILQGTGIKTIHQKGEKKKKKQSRYLRRPYNELWKHDKTKSKEKRKDLSISM